MLWISSSNELSPKGSNWCFPNIICYCLDCKKHQEQTKQDQRQSPHCSKTGNSNRNLRRNRSQTIKSNKQVTWNMFTIKAFLCISTNSLLLFFPPVTLFGERNEPGFRAAHIRCVKNPEEKTNENCFDSIAIRSLIALRISFVHFYTWS